MPDEKEKEEYKYVFALKKLIEYPEWTIFVDMVIKPQIVLREKKMVEPIGTPQQMQEHNVMVGELLGFNYAIAMPAKLIALAEEKKDFEDQLDVLEKAEKGDF